MYIYTCSVCHGNSYPFTIIISSSWLDASSSIISSYLIFLLVSVKRCALIWLTNSLPWSLMMCRGAPNLHININFNNKWMSACSHTYRQITLYKNMATVSADLDFTASAKAILKNNPLE